MYKAPHYVVFSTPSSLLGSPQPMFLPQCETPSSHLFYLHVKTHDCWEVRIKVIKRWG